MLRRVKVFVLMVVMTIMTLGVTVSASNIEDNVGGSNNASSGGMGDIFDGEIDSEDAAIGNWISDQRGMTSENLATASETLSPLANIVGNIIGGLVVLTFLGLFLTTAVDLLYISFPPIRGLLYKGGAQAGGAPMAGGGMGMPGMGMGMGMGGGRFSRMGMGMGGMAGGQMAGGQMGGGGGIQWISDEAVNCVALIGAGGQAAPMGGGMGANPMAMGMQQQPMQQPMTVKSVIGMYFKKRIIFMVLLAMCVIVLTSSALLDTGVNLALWLTKIINGINGNIPA